MGKKSKLRQQHTPLKSHTKRGTVLVPPLGALNIQLIDFERDLLPEHLWIAALARKFGLSSAHQPYERLMDALDEVWPDDKTPCLGLISDFGQVPVDERPSFLERHRDLIRSVFHDPIGRILAFYPDSPASWLIDKNELEKGGSLDPEVEIPNVRRLVLDLMPAKDAYAGHLRVLPFGRLLKHRKMFFLRDIEVVDLLPKYPTHLSEEERRHVQQFVRTALNTIYMQTERYTKAEWPRYFWRHNYNLVQCKPKALPITGARPISLEEGQELINKIGQSGKIAREYLDRLAPRLRLDLYDTTRDEILFGLFARLSRLFILIAEEVSLWARDTGGIMLRCLADTAITFCYLAIAGTDEDFRKFREYGEGQEKLLMLQLQDSYPGDKSLEGRSFEAISDELGGFVPEVLSIELGHWSKKDTRKLAAEAGLGRFYRLVYSPASSDLHGTWMSLKHSNLCRCAEALHRFHRLPAYTEPPAYVQTVSMAQDLYAYCVSVAVDRLGYPALHQQLPLLLSEREAGAGIPD